MANQQEMLKIEATCDMCKKTHTIEVPKAGYMQWLNGGARIQDAMPQLSDDDRELLISGTCGPCFDSLFADDED